MKNRYMKTALSHALGLALFSMASGAIGAPATSAAPAPQAGTPQAIPSSQTRDGSRAQSQKKKHGQNQATNVSGVTVTSGYLHSIQFSTDAKRNATNVVDTVFAEDIGKFPDTNIAESLNRIPGVQLERGVGGQGMQISIRGLGPSFTRVTLDDGSVATAYTDRNQQDQNREIDLNLFPSEFFTQLTVNKTPEAGMLEGGISGNVNLRTLRPFDHPGTHLTYSVKEGWNSQGGQYSPQGSLIGSWTNADNTFGVLLGVSELEHKSLERGYESIGWTTPGLTYDQCGLTPPAGTAANTEGGTTAGCNSIGGGNWRIPDTVPTTAGAGLVPGQTIDENFLLQHNPGLNIDQISNALIPRLSRPIYLRDQRNRKAAVLSLQYRPDVNMHFYLDTLFAREKRYTNSTDIDLIGRNGTMIPINEKVDGNGIVTKATYANSQYFLEASPRHQLTHFWSTNPGADIYFGDEGNIKLHVQGHVNRSWMRESVPSILFNTPYTTVQYSNEAGDHPVTASGVDLNDPGIGWTWNRVNIQAEHRVTTTRGARSYLQLGDDQNNVKVGFSFDQEGRQIIGYDNSAAWAQVVCQGTGSDVCDGGPGSAIPTSQISSYLRPGPAGFVAVDYHRLFAATDYYNLLKSAPAGGSVFTGATTGAFHDKNWGYFIETNGATEVLNRPLKFNAGIRYVTTNQHISGPVTQGSGTVEQSFTSDFDNVLPSFNIAWTVMDNVVLRLAGSRSMTRPNPSYMLPNTNFSDPSAQNASQGNPDLKPYTSDNFDLAGEWYTGGAGYVGLDLFNKDITGFTVNGIRTIPFSQLGISYGSLAPYQQAAIQQRGGPDVANVLVQSQVNAQGKLKIHGEEVDWVQPLDWVTQGLGVTANYTHIKQTSSGHGVSAVAVGVAPNLWNGTVYWEKGPASVRLSYSWTDKQISSGANQNGIELARIKTDSRGQLDLSASYTLKSIASSPQITLDATNLTDKPIRSTFQYSNAAYSIYNPGRTITLGIRGTF